MTDFILRAPDLATVNAGFQSLGAWREESKQPDGTVIPAGPITQGVTKSGQQWFIVVCGQLYVPKRKPDGWTYTQTKNEMGQVITTWKPNGPVVTTKDTNGNLVPVMQPYGTDLYGVLRWLGDTPPKWPKGVSVVDRDTLNPDVLAALTVIA